MGGLRRFVYYVMGGRERDCLLMGMGGMLVGGFLASSLYTSYEVKYFKMNKKNNSENSPRFIFGSEKVIQ
jgi:hypothetical protein